MFTHEHIHIHTVCPCKCILLCVCICIIYMCVSFWTHVRCWAVYRCLISNYRSTSVLHLMDCRSFRLQADSTTCLYWYFSCVMASRTSVDIPTVCNIANLSVGSQPLIYGATILTSIYLGEINNDSLIAVGELLISHWPCPIRLFSCLIYRLMRVQF